MPKDIDERWVDVDFWREDAYTFGAMAPDLAGFADYESEVGLLSDAEIMDEIERIDQEDSGAEQLVTRIFDQKREGSCVSQACAAAHQIVQAKELGKENVIQLSAMSLYKRIARSAQSGALVSDGLREMAREGLLPLDTAENRNRYGSAVMENTGFNQRFPSDWKLTAKHFRSMEWLRVSSVRAYYTALCKRHPVVVGREGHSVAHCVPVIYKGRRASQYVNSWSINWGFADAQFSGGFGIDTENQVAKSVRNGAFALRSNIYRGDD